MHASLIDSLIDRFDVCSCDYSYKADERLHLLAQVQLYMLLVSAQVFSQGGYLDTASDVAISVFLLIATIYFLLLFIQAVAQKLIGVLGSIPCCTTCLTCIADPCCSTKRARTATTNGAHGAMKGARGEVIVKSGSGGKLTTTPSQFVRTPSGRTVLKTNPRRRPVEEVSATGE